MYTQVKLIFNATEREINATLADLVAEGDVVVSVTVDDTGHGDEAWLLATIVYRTDSHPRERYT